MIAGMIEPPRSNTKYKLSPGWLCEREDRGFLMLTRTRFKADRFMPDGTAFDPREWLTVRDQGALRSGCGMALANCMEVVHWLKTGRVVRFSGSFAYLAAQKLSRTLGRDLGATVRGTVNAAKAFGLCRTSIVPDTQTYRDTFTVRARRRARRCRIWSHSMLGDYRDTLHFLAAGLGAVLLAVPWRETFASTTGIIEADEGPSLGGHTVAVVGIDDQHRDHDERPYLILANSQGRRWGDNGFALAAPRLFDDWGSRNDALIVGLSDMWRYQKRSTKPE